MAKYRLISSENGELEVEPKTNNILQVFDGPLRPYEGVNMEGLGVVRNDSIIVPRNGAEMFIGADKEWQDEILKQTKKHTAKVHAIKIPGYDEWYKTASPDGLRGEHITKGEHLYNNPQYFKDVVLDKPVMEMKRTDLGEDLPEEYISDEIPSAPVQNQGPMPNAQPSPEISPNTFLK